jgi:hypothetical protein
MTDHSHHYHLLPRSQWYQPKLLPPTPPLLGGGSWEYHGSYPQGVGR